MPWLLPLTCVADSVSESWTPACPIASMLDPYPHGPNSWCQQIASLVRWGCFRLCWKCPQDQRLDWSSCLLLLECLWLAPTACRDMSFHQCFTSKRLAPGPCYQGLSEITAFASNTTLLMSERLQAKHVSAMAMYSHTALQADTQAPSNNILLWSARDYGA